MSPESKALIEVLHSLVALVHLEVDGETSSVVSRGHGGRRQPGAYAQPSFRRDDEQFVQPCAEARVLNCPDEGHDRQSNEALSSPGRQDEPPVRPLEKAADPILYLTYLQVDFVLGELFVQKRHQLWNVIGQRRANGHV